MSQPDKTIICFVYDLGTIVGDLVKAGVTFKASPKHDEKDKYVIELTGGF